MSLLQRHQLPGILAVLVLALTAGSARAAVIHTDQLAVAEQKVNLLGIDATLTATGVLHFSFDEANPANDSVSDVFIGFLPSEFAVFGLAGAEFFLSSDATAVVTPSAGNTYLTVETTFNLSVPAASLVFYTQDPSLFESSINGLTDLSNAVFKDRTHADDTTFVYTDSFGSPGQLVGVSFDRTVTAVPEPGSIVLLTGLLALTAGAWRRKRCQE